MKRTLRTLLAVVCAVAGLLGVATGIHAQTLTTGTVAGTITDASGKKLSGVQIRILDTQQSDVTNANGYFVITDVLPGTHTVEASLVGYQPVQATNVVVTQELTTTVNLTLTQRTETTLGTTTVVAPLIHKNVTPTLYTVTSKDEQLIRSQPNNLYQYPGALISQPGIVPDQNGYPSVRGSRQNEVGYMLDGILVTEPVSGQFATNLVTVGMDRMNVYTGGYRADLGSSIGGIVNSVIKTGASMRGQAAVEASTGNWNYSGLVYEQGDVEKSGFNWYVSGNFFRTSYEKNHQISELPVSEDIVGKFIQPFGNKDRVTVLLTQGTERYELPIDDPTTGKPYGQTSLLPPDDPNYFPGYEAIHTRVWNESAHNFAPSAPTQDYSVQMYHIGSLTWSHQFTPGSSLAGQVYGWNQHVNFHLLSDWNSTDQRSGSTRAAGRLDYSNQVTSNLQLRLGGELLHSKSDAWTMFDLTYSYFFNEIVNDPTSPIAPIIYDLKNAPTTDDRNAYMAATWKPTDRLTADLGLRYDSREYNRQVSLADIMAGRTSANPVANVQAADLDVWNHSGGAHPKYDGVSPRVGFTYSLDPKTLLKASGGRFLEFAPTYYLERNFSNTALDVPLYIKNPDGTLSVYQPGDVNYFRYRSRKVFDVKPEKVDGVDVGIERQIGRNFGLAVTPYWRRTRDMFDFGQAYDSQGNPITYTNPDGSVSRMSAWGNVAKGHTKGVETKLEMRQTHGLSGWITYTYQKAMGTTTASFPGQSNQTLTRNDQEHRLDYDQRHTIYVVGQYVKGSFEINPMLELGSGYPWGGQPGNYFDPESGTTNPYYSASPLTGEPLPVIVNGKLQDPFQVNPFNTGWHRNLSVTFRLYTNKQKSSYYFLQVQNIINSADVLAKNWYDPNSGSNVFGFVGTPITYVNENNETVTSPGYFTYKPYTRVPPPFVLIGVHQTF